MQTYQVTESVITVISVIIHSFIYLLGILRRSRATQNAEINDNTYYTVSQIKRGHFSFHHNFYSC